jgi:hypothetical protein
LVSCQSSQDESISGTYGHLPLDLFVEWDSIGQVSIHSVL